MNNDQFNVSRDQFLMTILDIFLSILFFSMTSLISLSVLIFFITRDQFEKGYYQNWSQNQLVRLLVGWSWPDWSQKLEDPIFG